MVIEAILSFNIMFVAMVVSDPRKPSLLGSAVVGFSIGTGAMAAVSYSINIRYGSTTVRRLFVCNVM